MAELTAADRALADRRLADYATRPKASTGQLSGADRALLEQRRAVADARAESVIAVVATGPCFVDNGRRRLRAGERAEVSGGDAVTLAMVGAAYLAPDVELPWWWPKGTPAAVPGAL